MHQWTLFLAPVVAAISATVSGQTILHVNVAVGPGGDGLTWESAFDQLFDALDEAAINPEVAQIWVAQGTYTPDRGAGNRDDTFQLVSGVGLFGGFLGGERELEQRDPETNKTIVSGDFNGDDGENFINYAENARHVVTASGVDATAVLDGFTIRSGNADFPGEQLLGGGGMFIVTGSPTIDNCTFEANSTGENRPNIGGFGGAVYINGGDVTISDCRFLVNRGDNGGALGVFDHDDAAHNVTVTNCEFLSNRAIFGLGGAVFSTGDPFDNQTQRDLTFRNCHFADNAASSFGAIIDQNTLNFAVIDCRFENNSAGAIWRSQTADQDVTPINPATILRCEFVENEGGALFFASAEAFVVNCIFLGNHADAGEGGAIWAGPYVFGGGESLEVHNSLFSGNTAVSGGAITLINMPLSRIVNSTFAQNSATVVGGGIAAQDSHFLIDNSILWNNDVNGVTIEATQIAHFGSNVSVNFSTIQGLTGALGGLGNIGDDPMFNDPLGEDGIPGTDDDDAQLSSGSPSIDAADNLAVPLDLLDLDDDGDTDEALPLDLDLAARFVDDPETKDQGNGDPPIVDMGAYEFQVVSCVWDLDDDDNVGTGDLIVLLGSWGNPYGTPDLIELLGNWGPCPK